jgi:hypothetical protein
MSEEEKGEYLLCILLSILLTYKSVDALITNGSYLNFRHT